MGTADYSLWHPRQALVGDEGLALSFQFNPRSLRRRATCTGPPVDGRRPGAGERIRRGTRCIASDLTEAREILGTLTDSMLTTSGTTMATTVGEWCSWLVLGGRPSAPWSGLPVVRRPAGDLVLDAATTDLLVGRSGRHWPRSSPTGWTMRSMPGGTHWHPALQVNRSASTGCLGRGQRPGRNWR